MTKSRIKNFLFIFLVASVLGTFPLLAQTTLPTEATTVATNLGASAARALGSAFVNGAPFTAGAGNFAPLEYHFLVPLVDVYLSGPIILGAGKVDFSSIDSLGAALGTDIGKSLGPFKALGYFPIPVVAAAAKFRLTLPIPILKDLEVTAKFGGIPTPVQDLLKAQLANIPGMKLDFDNTLIGVGARYRFVNLKVFQMSGALGYNNINGKFNLSFTTPKQTLGTFSNVTYTQDQTISITNEYNFSVLTLDLMANLNLSIFQLYGGLGLNLDVSKPYTSSFGIGGVVYQNGVASTAGLSVGGIVPLDRAVLVPKFSLGFRFAIIDISAESTFDLKSLALRAGIALSI